MVTRKTNKRSEELILKQCLEGKNPEMLLWLKMWRGLKKNQNFRMYQALAIVVSQQQLS